MFATMFSLRPGEGLEEGNSDEHPIVLEDVKAVDFERLLALFYPSECPCPCHTVLQLDFGTRLSPSPEPRSVRRLQSQRMIAGP